MKALWLVSVIICTVLSSPNPVAAAGVWTPVTCSHSPLVAYPMQKCYSRITANLDLLTDCTHPNRYFTSSTSADIITYSFAMVPNGRQCYIALDSDFQVTFKTALRIFRWARNWQPLTKVGGAVGMFFDFPRRHCFAFYKLGPRSPYNTSGFTVTYDGYVCGARGKSPITNKQITSFINSVHLR